MSFRFSENGRVYQKRLKWKRSEQTPSVMEKITWLIQDSGQSQGKSARNTRSMRSKFYRDRG
jgi:hypothetical protein